MVSNGGANKLISYLFHPKQGDLPYNQLIRLGISKQQLFKICIRGGATRFLTYLLSKHKGNAVVSYIKSDLDQIIKLLTKKGGKKTKAAIQTKLPK